MLSINVIEGAPDENVKIEDKKLLLEDITAKHPELSGVELGNFIDTEKKHIRKSRPEILEILLVDVLNYPFITPVLGQGVSIKADRPMRAISKLGIINIAAGVDFEVEKIKIDLAKLGQDLVINHSYSAQDADIIFMGINEALKSGSFRHHSFTLLENKYFTQTKLPLNYFHEIVVSDKAQLEHLFDWIEYIRDTSYSVAKAHLFYNFYTQQLKTPGSELGKLFYPRLKAISMKTHERIITPFNEKQTELVKRFAELLETEFTPGFEWDTMSKLNNYDALSIIFAYDDKIIDQFQDRLEYKKFVHTLRDQEIKRRGVVNEYMAIIKTKIGLKKYQELIDKNIRSEQEIFSILSQGDKDVVKLTYIKQKKYAEMIAKNTCVHIKTHRSFRNAASINDKKIWLEKLRNFYDGKGTSGFMKCKICEFDIICPHIDELTDIMNDRNYHTRAKDIMQKYISQNISLDSSFCKICGELIEKRDDKIFDHEMGIVDELNKVIWSEANRIVSNIQFKTIVNYTDIVRNVIFKTRPHIEKIESQLLKSKMTDSYTIKNLLSLYSAIYCWGYVVHLIEVNTHQREMSLFGMRADAKANILLSKVYANILTTKNVSINKIKNITSEYIQKILIQAYRTFKSDEFDVIKFTNNTNDIIRNLVLDPIFNFMLNVEKTHRRITCETVGEMRNCIEIILGKKITELESMKYIYGADGAIGGRQKVSASNSASNSAKSHDSASNSAKSHNGEKSLMLQSFKNFKKYVQSRVWLEPPWLDNFTINPSYEKIFNDSDKFIEIEKEIRKKNLLKHMRPIYFFNMASNRQWNPSIMTNLDISKYYDNHGKSQIWDLFVYSDAPIAKADPAIAKADLAITNIYLLSRADIIDITLEKHKIKYDSFRDMKLIDMKSSISGVYKSESQLTSEPKQIVDILHNKEIKKNFFEYYSNRCPEGGLHDIIITPNEPEGKCKKCNFISKTDKFYNKYITKYENKNFENAAILINKLNQFTAPKELIIRKKIDWKYDESIIERLANMLKIHIKYIKNLANVEGKEYSDVENDTIKQEYHKTRVNNLDTYIKYIFAQYYSLKNMNKAQSPPAALKNIFSKIKGYAIVHTEYNTMINTVKINFTTKDQILFIIEHICRVLLGISLAGGEVFAKYILNHFIFSDKLTSKPGRNKLSAILSMSMDDMADGTKSDMRDDKGGNLYEDFNDVDIDFENIELSNS
ncbi:MAG: hypothetical protein KAS12_01605 [Candidatus Aenigmarchaeota archaeon]|nr:hypothetical protein [Candidatus Aenigmarchaeota archaeon]